MGLSPIHAYPRKADIASTGSILEHLPEDYGGIILGSDLIDAASRRAFPNATVLSGRGKLTRTRIEDHSNHIRLGDPGLLAGKMVHSDRPKKYTFGLVPHHSNLNAPFVAGLRDQAPGAVCVISPIADAEPVIRQ